MSHFFSVIIPTYKRHDTLLECLKHLNEAAKESNNIFEVIVTDDDNVKATRDFLSTHTLSFSLKIVEGPKKGPAANRNNGAKYSSCEWLIFIDDDCLPDKNIIKNYFKSVQTNYLITAFEGKIFTDRQRNRYDEEAPVNVTGNNFWSCNICVKKERFLRIGGFDEKFPYPYMEDVDLHVRLKEDNNETMFVADASVEHPWRPKRGWKGYMKSASSILYFCGKNYKFLKISKYQYFKIFLGGFPHRLSLLMKFKFRGTKDFMQENLFYFIMAIKFYIKFSKNTY